MNYPLESHSEDGLVPADDRHRPVHDAFRPKTPINTKPIHLNDPTSPPMHHSTSENKYLSGIPDNMRGFGLFYGIDIEKVVNSMKDEGLVTERKRLNRISPPLQQFTDFLTAPALQKAKEEIVFAPLGVICKRATDLVSAHLDLEPTVLMCMRPNHAPRSHRASSTRPDAYNILREVEETLRRQEKEEEKVSKAKKSEPVTICLPRWWYDIALTYESKKNELVKDQDDNNSKLVFNVQQTMALDPCRRFTFGVTIENTSMRLWFCCRSIAVVSKVIDFTKEVALLMQIFLSFAFATKEELGWDPTVRPVIVNEERKYEIDVDGETYITVKMLSDFSADALISRATRVWLVKHLATGSLNVLKDIWVGDDRTLEHEIYEAILHDIETRYGPEARQKATSHFLTPVSKCIVHINGVEDHTTAVIMRGYEPPFETGSNLKIYEPTVSNDKRAVQHPVASDRIASQPDTFKSRTSIPFTGRRKKLHHRKHYRIIFEEVGHNLHTVNNLSRVFLVLRDCAEVLEWIHGCGWTHRDISVMNLYYYNGRGIIGDLEYAKKRDSVVTHELRSCCLDFIACEAMKNKYLHLPEADAQAILEGKVSLAQISGRDNFSFFHNGLHDLESLWWVALWILFFNRDASGAVNETLDKSRELAMNKLFPRTDEHEHRASVLESMARYVEAVGWMNGTFQVIGNSLNMLRTLLVVKYKAFEAMLPNLSWETIDGTQRIFATIFNECMQESSGVNLIPYKTTGLRYVTADPEDQEPEAALNEALNNVHLDDNGAEKPLLLHLERCDLSSDSEWDNGAHAWRCAIQ